MERVQPGQIATFMKRFRFQNGVLKRVRLQNRSRKEASLLLLLIVKEAKSGEKIRLKLQFDDVEEFRFQRRPAGGVVVLKEVHFGTFNGFIYLNLDAFDEPAPQLMDFRASDAYVGAKEMSFEIVVKK